MVVSIALEGGDKGCFAGHDLGRPGYRQRLVTRCILVVPDMSPTRVQRAPPGRGLAGTHGLIT